MYEVLTGHDCPFVGPPKNLLAPIADSGGRRSGDGSAGSDDGLPGFLPSDFGGRRGGAGGGSAGPPPDPIAQKAKLLAARAAVEGGAKLHPAAMALLSSALPARQALEARQLVQWMCAFAIAERPTMGEVLAHPLFWSIEARSLKQHNRASRPPRRVANCAVSYHVMRLGIGYVRVISSARSEYSGPVSRPQDVGARIVELKRALPRRGAGSAAARAGAAGGQGPPDLSAVDAAVSAALRRASAADSSEIFAALSEGWQRRVDPSFVRRMEEQGGGHLRAGAQYGTGFQQLLRFARNVVEHPPPADEAAGRRGGGAGGGGVGAGGAIPGSSDKDRASFYLAKIVEALPELPLAVHAALLHLQHDRQRATAAALPARAGLADAAAGGTAGAGDVWGPILSSGGAGGRRPSGVEAIRRQAAEGGGAGGVGGRLSPWRREKGRWWFVAVTTTGAVGRGGRRGASTAGQEEAAAWVCSMMRLEQQRAQEYRDRLLLHRSCTVLVLARLSYGKCCR